MGHNSATFADRDVAFSVRQVLIIQNPIKVSINSSQPLDRYGSGRKVLFKLLNKGFQYNPAICAERDVVH